ncbi:MAG: flagellar export protein FliJ [Gammaproteobacteria bacterium]|nr:flagellar export protein FliJ [Gammaproteobacteria bacterium]
MMKKSQRLRPVRDLKQQQERQEARKLADMQQQLIQARRQHEELQGYLREYFTAISTTRQQVKQASQLGLYQSFITRLQDAIQHQGQLIRQREQVVQAQTRKWLEASSRLKSLDDLIARARQQEELAADKREQKIQDDRPHRSSQGFE